MSKKTAKPKTFAFVSLGCPKNLVDSERMLGKLAQDGYVLSPDAEGADIVVINTCGFIEPARQESFGVIREMVDLKNQGKVGSVVVAGCLAERKGDQLLCWTLRESESNRRGLASSGARRLGKSSIARTRIKRNNAVYFGRRPLRPRRIRLACA